MTTLEQRKLKKKAKRAEKLITGGASGSSHDRRKLRRVGKPRAIKDGK